MRPLVGIIMGSDSDYPVMKQAGKILENLDIPFEVTVVSAHRTPERMYDYAKTARRRGLKVIIAGAGGAAHLPGMVSALTTLPVIGVPVQSKTMNGIDSLYSIVQMPPGVPTATVSINGAKNAGILALQIIGTFDNKVAKRLEQYKNNLKKIVKEKASDIELIAKPNVLKSISLSGLGKKHSGKVRDFYIVGDKRVMITTDRQSSFNYNIGYVPYKGAVLNQLSAFWFNKTKKVVNNHMISIPHPNVLISHNCKPIPIEMVVRGYLTGVTNTSPWGNYKKGERMIYGLRFPDGLKKNQKLPKPIITPTGHPDPESGSHDDKRMTREDIIEQKLVPEDIYLKMEKVALKLFDIGSKWCKNKGLILVDTKYEFGLKNGKLMLYDEIHTPDSSRFWIAKTYKKRLEQGLEPENFDKEFLRLYYVNKLGYTGTGIPQDMPKDLIVQLAKRYIAVYEMITGKKFVKYEYPIKRDIQKALSKYTTS